MKGQLDMVTALWGWRSGEKHDEVEGSQRVRGSTYMYSDCFNVMV